MKETLGLAKKMYRKYFRNLFSGEHAVAIARLKDKGFGLIGGT